MNAYSPTNLTVFTLLLLATSQLAHSQHDALEQRRALLNPENRAVKFQTAEETHPRRMVRASSATWPLESAERKKPFEVAYSWDGRTYGIDDFNRRTRTSALLILKNETVVSEIYRSGSTDTTRFISFSAGKSIVSTLVGMAIEDGSIGGVDDPLTKYLPALIGSAYESVSIKDALQMLSGIQFDTADVIDWTDESNPFARVRRESMVEHRYRFVEAANGLPRDVPVGTKFIYNTMNTALLGWVIENATGKRLATYMEERLWQPAGMESDAAWLLDGPPEIGREFAGGDFVATLRDYGRFGLLMLNGGRANGKQLVSVGWVESATTASRAPIQCGNLFPDSPLGYGYSWWLLPSGRFVAEGVFGQMIYVAPDAAVVIVKLSHWPKSWDYELEKECYAFFDAVSETLKREERRTDVEWNQILRPSGSR